MTKYKHNEAFRFITYRGEEGTEETVWNSRDGKVPFLIHSKNGKYQLNRVKGIEKRRVNHTLKEGEYYFASMTRERAKYLAQQFVKGRWLNPRYPLYLIYETKKAARYVVFKNFYGESEACTILRYGKDTTTYMTKQFRNFIGSTIAP